MDNRNSDPPPSYELATYNTQYGVHSSLHIAADQQSLVGLPRQGVSYPQARFQQDGEWNSSRENPDILPEQQDRAHPNPDPPPSYEQATYNTQYGVHSSQQIGADQQSLVGLQRQGVSYPQVRLQPQGEWNSRIWFCAFPPEQQVGARPKPDSEYTLAGNRDQTIPQTSQPRTQSQPGFRQPGYGQEQIRQTPQPAPNQSSPTNYWVQTCFAVVSLCCCFPTGLCALYFARKAKVCAASGRTDKARRKSKCAICLIVTSFVFGLTWICFFIVVGT